jgi:hypothetical protein
MAYSQVELKRNDIKAYRKGLAVTTVIVNIISHAQMQTRTQSRCAQTSTPKIDKHKTTSMAHDYLAEETGNVRTTSSQKQR